MQALDKKLMRDFGRLWVQGLAIAVVLACGVAILLTAFGMNAALTDTRDAYYERNRFADIFTDTSRAPLTLLPISWRSRASMPPSRACRARPSSTCRSGSR